MNKLVIATVIGLLVLLSCSSNERLNKSEKYASLINSQEVFVVVEEMPIFPGGTRAMVKYINSNLNYPQEAKEKSIIERVVVDFVIEKDGKVSNAVVRRPINPILDKEAIRIIQSMPKWSPGKQKGIPVRVSYAVPINFKLK